MPDRRGGLQHPVRGDGGRGTPSPILRAVRHATRSTRLARPLSVPRSIVLLRCSVALCTTVPSVISVIHVSVILICAGDQPCGYVWHSPQKEPDEREHRAGTRRTHGSRVR